MELRNEFGWMLVCGDVSLGFVVRVAGHTMIHYFHPLLLLARLPNICEYADDHGRWCVGRVEVTGTSIRRWAPPRLLVA